MNIYAAETSRGSILGYDPKTYVETSFFGEEDTRSNLVRLVSETLTKIINVPNMKEHQASGVTGCLKNIAYGNFSNVARSHRFEKTNTLTFIGTLAATEPVRSRVVLNIMDGLRGVWHAGPFSDNGAIPLLSQADDVRHRPGGDGPQADRGDRSRSARRKARSPSSTGPCRTSGGTISNPNMNHFIREPGHVEYAGEARAGRLRRRENQAQGDRAVMLLLLAALPALFWDGAADTAPALREAGITQIAVPAAQSAAWKGVAGSTAEAADLQGAVKLLAPTVNYRMNQASATSTPWLMHNGWRFLRQPAGALLLRRHGRTGGAGGRGSVLLRRRRHDPDGCRRAQAAWREMLAVPADVPARALPPVADIGFIDDGSADAGEVMNLMVRGNLLFRMVPRAGPALEAECQARDKGVSAGGREESRHRWRSLVRANLTDEKRSLRVYGSQVVVARLTARTGKARLHLLNYAGADRQGGWDSRAGARRIFQARVAAAGSAGVELLDYSVEAGATEFTLPELKTYAVIDLSR